MSTGDFGSFGSRDSKLVRRQESQPTNGIVNAAGDRCPSLLAVEPESVRRTQPCRAAKRVALVGLSDSSASVLERYAVSCDWVIAAVVATRPGGAVADVAASLRIPVSGSLDRTVLSSCDDIVVGEIGDDLREILQAMIDPERTRMIGVADALEEFRVGDPPPSLGPRDPAMSDLPNGRVLLASERLFGPHDAKIPSALWIDTNHPALAQALESLVNDTGAFFVSLMLPADEGRRLQVVATGGPKRTTPTGDLPLVGSGTAGKAFAQEEFQIRRDPLPNLAEEDEKRLVRIAASHPVMISGELIGVLSLNIDACEEIDGPTLRAQMDASGKRIARAVMSAIDLEAYPLEICDHLLPRIVDRILSQDEPLPDRILAVSQALRRSLHGAGSQLYLVDRLNDRLRMIPSCEADGDGSGGCLVDHGLLRLALRHRGPQVLEFTPVDLQEQTGIICQPIYLTRPYGLVRIDGVPLGDGRREIALRVMSETVRQVEEMILVEEQVAAQDLLQELEMRIADRSDFLRGTDPHQAIRRVLDLAVEVVAAETAMWIPPQGGPPIVPAPVSAQAARIQAVVWNQTDALMKEIRQEGAVVGRIDPGGLDPGTSHTVVPYVGVLGKERPGALIAFFTPDECGGVPAQVSSELLWRVLQKLCGLLIASDQDFRQSAAPTTESSAAA